MKCVEIKTDDQVCRGDGFPGFLSIFRKYHDILGDKPFSHEVQALLRLVIQADADF